MIKLVLIDLNHYSILRDEQNWVGFGVSSSIIELVASNGMMFPYFAQVAVTTTVMEKSLGKPT